MGHVINLVICFRLTAKNLPRDSCINFVQMAIKNAKEKIENVYNAQVKKLKKGKKKKIKVRMFIKN